MIERMRSLKKATVNKLEGAFAEEPATIKSTLHFGREGSLRTFANKSCEVMSHKKI